MQWQKFVNRGSDLIKSHFNMPDKCKESKIYPVTTYIMPPEELDKPKYTKPPYNKPTVYDFDKAHEIASNRSKQAWERLKAKQAQEAQNVQ